jgi:hypothetical protein
MDTPKLARARAHAQAALAKVPALEDMRTDGTPAESPYYWVGYLQGVLEGLLDATAGEGEGK